MTGPQIAAADPTTQGHQPAPDRRSAALRASETARPGSGRRARFTDFAVSPAEPLATATAIRGLVCCEDELTGPEGAHGLDCPTTQRDHRGDDAA